MIILIDDDTGACKLSLGYLGIATHFQSIRDQQTGVVTITITVDTSQPQPDGKTSAGDAVGGIAIAGTG